MHQFEDFLALAYQADQAAENAGSQVARNTWKMLAAEYRKRALLALKQPEPEALKTPP